MDTALQTKIKALIKDFKKEHFEENFLFECESLAEKNQKLYITLHAQFEKKSVLELHEMVLKAQLKTILPEHEILLTFTAPKTSSPKKPEKISLPNIKSIIAVSSGKGGVGKSTLSVQTAYTLAKLNPDLNIGILDADIYGPSIPTMLNLSSKPELDVNKKLIPFTKDNLQIMSMGFMVDPEAPIIWRGPMIQKGIRQLFEDVAWDTIDIMIVDMPPGTGDAHLTMAQNIPLSGAIIVSTPQDIALIDARKSWHMYQKLNVPIIGLIENMSSFKCENCDHETHIFGHHGAKKSAIENDIPFITELPLDLKIRTHADQGEFLVDNNLHLEAFKCISDKILTFQTS